MSCRYDCSPHALGYIDYCVHFMSRTPTMAPEKLEALKVVVITVITDIIIVIIVSLAEPWLSRSSLSPSSSSSSSCPLQSLVLGMGLNSHDLDYKTGDQTGCW